MKISLLIKKLTAAQATHGDAEVIIDPCAELTPDLTHVDDVDYDKFDPGGVTYILLTTRPSEAAR